MGEGARHHIFVLRGTVKDDMNGSLTSRHFPLRSPRLHGYTFCIIV
jgi:hypothetical protein